MQTHEEARRRVGCTPGFLLAPRAQSLVINSDPDRQKDGWGDFM